MSQQEDLCISCGLCCDGTLYQSVQLFEGDPGENLIALGAEISPLETVSEMQTVMKLGCAAHQDGCCQVYAHRPKHCQRFECRTLKAVASGTMSFSDAQTIISDTIAVCDALKKTAEDIDPALGDKSVQELMKLCHDTLTPETSVDQRVLYAPMLIEAAVLDQFKKKYFIHD
ncbi:MAG: hypothetical protein AAGI12_08525 [Pseudomonadota bacterium]